MENINLEKVKHFVIWWITFLRWKVLYNILYCSLPINEKRICVVSWNGRYFNCNPKAIATYLSTHNQEKLQVIAIVDNPQLYKNSFPNIKFVKTRSVNHLIAQLSCKIFVANIRMPEFEKKKGQIYIQTWHGMGPKKSEKDSSDTLTPKYIKNAIKDCDQTDIMLSGSKWQTDWIRNSTWYKGRILEVGTPRDDCFFNKEKYAEMKSRVYSTYSINPACKIVLYAPTFRSVGEIAKNKIDVPSLLKTFSNKFGGEFILLLRLHPNVAKQPLPEIYAKYLSSKVFNVTSYPDMQDLLCASDVLITDFSSVSTEFVMQDKPCFLFVPDYKTYDRGLYFKLEDMPFPYGFNDKQLINKVELFDMNLYTEKVLAYKNKIGMNEFGVACRKIQEFLNIK